MKLRALVVVTVCLGAMIFVLPASALAANRGGAPQLPAVPAARSATLADGRVEAGTPVAAPRRASASGRGISAVHVSASLVASDAYEPDDTTATATDVQFGVTQQRTIDSTDRPDYDFLKFTTVAGTTYTFDTTGTADTVLELYNGQTDPQLFELFAWNDDKDVLHGDFGSRVTWTARSSGVVVYAIVSPANPLTGSGDYELSATESTAGPIPAEVNPVWGRDRYYTAAAIAETAFPGMTYFDDSDNATKPVDTVIIANGDDAKAPDPLAAAPLAGIKHSPIFLVSALKVPSATTYEIGRVKAGNAGKLNIVVIGGRQTVPDAIYNSLARVVGPGGTITRISGADRYEIAGAIADRVSQYWMSTYGHQPPKVFISSGAYSGAFWDALAAGPMLYRSRCPLLLTKATTAGSPVNYRVTHFYADPQRTQVIILNLSYMSWGVVTSIGVPYQQIPYWADSPNRAEAAESIATWSWAHWLVPSTRIAVTNKLADSLAGGVGMGELGGSLLYTSPIPAETNTHLADPTWVFLYQRGSVFRSAYILGGPGSVGSVPAADVRQLLH